MITTTAATTYQRRLSLAFIGGSLAHALDADFGNVLRHGYEQVIDARVWEIVTRDLAPLKAAVEAMLREVEADERT